MGGNSHIGSSESRSQRSSECEGVFYGCVVRTGEFLLSVTPLPINTAREGHVHIVLCEDLQKLRWVVRECPGHAVRGVGVQGPGVTVVGFPPGGMYFFRSVKNSALREGLKLVCWLQPSRPIEVLSPSARPNGSSTSACLTASI